MYQLYYSPATAAMVVHWLLIELNIEHQLHSLDFAKKEQKSPEYLKVNPSGLVPALLIDGTVMTEAPAISMYLVDTHAYGKLSPTIESAERSEYLQWMFYFANTLQPAFRQWFYPQDFGDKNVVKPVAQKTIESAFVKINLHLADGRDYFLGDNISTLDFFVIMLMRWTRNMSKPATELPHLNRLAVKMKSMPSFKEMYRREGLTDWV